MEDPASPAARSTGASDSPDSPSGISQTSISAQHDQLAESFALEDATSEQPSASPFSGGSSVGRHAAANASPWPSEQVDPSPGGDPADPADLSAATGLPAESTRSGRRKRHRRHKAPWWELPLLILIAVVVAMLIKTFVVQPYYIPSESMENTLYGCAGCSGDRILVNKPIYSLRDPHPGDIVVFEAPPHWDNEPVPQAPSNPLVKGVRWVGQLVGIVPPDENDLVKRVIATGGQTVRCCDDKGNLQVSDDGPDGPWRSLDEPYVFENLPWDPATSGTSTTTQLDQRKFGPVTIPKGRLWVMGDHRSVSEDSRWHYTHDSVGDAVASTVPVDSVIGKAVLIVWPPSRWATLGTPATFTSSAATAIGGPVAPPLAAFAVVAPIWLLRRRRRRW